MSHVPGVWSFALLVLAAYRSWYLFAHDAITEWLRGWLPDRWVSFMECPYCFGAWCALAWWCGWIAWPHGAIVATTPFALSAVVAAIALAVASLAD